MPTKPRREKTPAAQTAGVSSAQNQSTNERTEPMNSISASKNEPAVLATSQPVGFIRFHSLTLLVVEADAIQYVPVKPIIDLLGLDWRNQRTVIQAGDNAVLYGTRRLISPVFNAVSGGLKTPPAPSGDLAEDGLDTENLSQIGDRHTDLCIRLDRAHMFLARVNTSRVRSNGNVDAANYLLDLQVEWAEALHSYQLHGVAVKEGSMAERKSLGDLMKNRVLAGPREKPAFDRMIAASLNDLGYPIEEDAQQQLPLEDGSV